MQKYSHLTEPEIPYLADEKAGIFTYNHCQTDG